MDALAIGLSTQRALAQSVDTIAYNLANASTTGFRATAERFERKSRMADGVPVDMVQSQAGALERASGSLTKTDNPLDVAVSQDRWLGVQTQAGVGYTKDGRLKIAESGMLMTSMDLPVVDESGAPIMVNPAGGPLLIRQNGVVLQDGAEAGRIGLVPFDPLLKVHSVWDLGWNDSMSIILAQRQASGVRVIKYIEDSHRTLSSYAQDLIELKFDGRAPRWGSDWLPHDGFTKDFKTGKTAQEILQALGRTVDRVPNMTIKAGIDAAREVFPRVYFHKPETVRLVECLKRYRRDVSQKTGEPGQPVHDEFSHGADCWRYLALCVDQMHNEDWSSKPLSYKSLGYA